MNKIVSTCALVRFKNFALLYSRVGAGATRAGAASKFFSEPHKNAAPQDCKKLPLMSRVCCQYSPGVGCNVQSLHLSL
jgi:hypothetical protein